MDIKLGPLLGLEADYNYTVCFLLPGESKAKLSLRLNFDQTTTVVNNPDVSILLHHHFYRFSFDLPKKQNEYQVEYQILSGNDALSDQHQRTSWQFAVASQKEVPNIGFASCNGSSKQHPSKLSSSEFVMWDKMKQLHEKEGERIHLLLMGGDQIYADSVWDEVPFIDSLKKRNWYGKRILTEDIVASCTLDPKEQQELENQLREFYEQLYIDSWSDKNMSYMLASAPNLMIWDDHDIVDGWGSYSNKFQSSVVMQLIFSIAKAYFEIFQARTSRNSALISNSDFTQKTSFRNFEIFLLDNRTFRTSKKVMSKQQFVDVDSELKKPQFVNIPPEIADERVICFVVPVPIAHLDYHRIAEKALTIPFTKDFRHSMHDDALDHWDHDNHKKEQIKLLELIFAAGKRHKVKYLCIVSGDVHTAGAATVTQDQSKRYATQLVSSGTVHAPPSIFEYFFMRAGARRKVDHAGYELDLKNYGNFDSHTIRQRNFGVITKPAGRGMLSTISTEHDGIFFRTLKGYK